MGDFNLAEIQQKLKAPKGQFNDFGKYNYRNCEDILEAVKPLLAEYGATIVLTDDIVLIGNRYYVKATAILSDGVISYSTCAFARESETKKGMDESQITGSSSSYARKYALNGLFAIDDTDDADSTNQHGNGQDKKPKHEAPKSEAAKSESNFPDRKPWSDPQRKKLWSMMKGEKELTDTEAKRFFEYYIETHANEVMDIDGKKALTAKGAHDFIGQFEQAFEAFTKA
jgi:hypothetical protein